MYSVSDRRSAGFTIVETLVGLAIVGLILAVGVPSMANWVRLTKVEGAEEFYLEAFRMARGEAVKHKAESRIVLSTGANGQFDYQIDICFPTPTVICDDATGGWSTPVAMAANDPDPAGAFLSIVGTAKGLPDSNVLDQSVVPVGASEVYYTPLGWIDTTVAPWIRRLDLFPPTGSSVVYPNMSVAITLSGMASKCMKDAIIPDSRACPP